MNDPRFEIYPHRSDGVDPETQEPARIPTGEYGWRFRAGNGRITAVAGEGFTRREDAERAVADFNMALGEAVREIIYVPD